MRSVTSTPTEVERASRAATSRLPWLLALLATAAFALGGTACGKKPKPPVEPKKEIAKPKPPEPKDKDDGLKSCKVDEDCEDDEDCIDGKCRKPWQDEAPEGVTCQMKPVYFSFDSEKVEEEYRTSMNETASCIKEAPENRGVYIVGYTDPRGTEEYNIALSERRARAVADFLAALGIDPERFRITPKGSTEASGVDDDSWSKDRRVEFEWR